MLDDEHYRNATSADDEGHNDGYAGKPDRTAEFGTFARYYAGGYESGQLCRKIEDGANDEVDA